MSPIQITRSSMPSFDEYTEEIKDLWHSRLLTNMGVKHKQLEEQLSSYLGTPNISLFTNGHLALECAIAVYGLEGEVITTPFTFASTTHAIARNKLTPIFCDIDQYDYTMDVNQLENKITERTSAIIPVHVYGNICNMETIEKIAKKYKLKVIYDAAHTFGVTVNGKGIGAFGDISMFSFHATKVFHTIEGGALSFSEPELATKLNSLKNFGITGPDSVDYVGGNAKMNEFQAAMGICNLRHVDDEIAKRKQVVERYFTNLGDINGLQLSAVPKGIKSNYAYFPVVFDGYKKDRNQVFEELKQNDIIARKYFYPVTNSFRCYSNENNPSDTPIAKYISERVLCLPLYSDLSFPDIDRICKIIKE